jgi:formylglycine-generating enzyme required for sulfatase activity
MSAKLRSLGFEVTLLTNRNRGDLTTAVIDFGRRAAGADAALFYFAGHGVQVKGANYLLPVGRRFSEEAEVEGDAVEVRFVLGQLEAAGAKVSLLILDACRSNPLRRPGRAAQRGLARMDAPSGALIAFAAQPGAEADDGSGGRNGTYTKHLLQHIGTPGLQVEEMFKLVRAGVERETGRKQSPREQTSLTTSFYFAAPAALPPIEDEAWALCRNAATTAPCQDYLATWPQGRYAQLARTKLRDLEGARPPPVVAPRTRSPGEVFTDCADCPEMVDIGAGSFTMGSVASEAGRDEDEGPQCRVKMARPFALGRYEVKVGEFRRFVQATSHVTEAERNVGNAGCYAYDDGDGKWDWRAGRSWRSPGFEQTDRHPVVCVSWNDVQAYVQWLGRLTGQGYRLASEAEWEYAARAGSITSRPWGDDPNDACRHANVTDQSKSPSGRNWGERRHECSDSHWFARVLP